MSSPPKKDLLKPLGSRPKTPGRTEPRERSDRFISNRGATDIENAKLLEQVDTGGSEFKTELAKQLSIGKSNKLLAFQSSKPKTPQKPQEELLPISSAGPQSGRKPTRHIPALPDRILDAPELKDDFNVNVLHWSAGNQLAVGLGPSLYLWNGETGDVSMFQDFDPTDVTAVRWDGSGAHVALGMADKSVLMFNVARQKQVRILRGHTSRVTSLAWNGPVLTSGGGSDFIMNSDVRIKEHCKDKMHLHDKEVCGLAWNSEGDQLASGGADNIVGIWDGRKLQQAQHVLAEHRAAVKALAWCPWQRRMLATGGGDGDRQVRLWDTKTGTQMSCFDANAVVGALVWNPHEKELLGGLGYPNFQIALWRYPTCQLMGEFFGHDQRILHMALSPDQCTVCSGGGDETLRFWKMFQKPAAKRVPLGAANAGSHSVLKSVSIR